MTKKGFTLVELIGVIAILGVLAVFAIPALTKTLKKSSDKEYEEFVKNITLAAENYFHSETDGKIMTNSKKFIKVQDLKDAGYLKNNVNPLTNTNVSNDATVIITKNTDGVEKYEFVDKDVTIYGYVSEKDIHYDGYTEPQNGYLIDLTSNHNNAEMNNVTWNNSFYNFNGNSYAKFNSINTLPASYSLVIKAPYQESNVVFGDINTNAAFGFYSLDNKMYGIASSGTVQSAKYKMFDLTNYPFDQITSIQLVYTSSNIELYINGKSVTSVNNINYWTWTDNYSYLGGRPQNGGLNSLFSGNIYSFIAYHKALTTDEIKQNYEVDKYRFGAGE